MKKEKQNITWHFFSDEMPEPYKKIKINLTEEIIDSKTYIHNGKLMLKLVDENNHFIGCSPKLLDEKTKWCYL